MLHIKMNGWNHSTNVWAEFFPIRACFGFDSFPQLRYTIYVFQFTVKIFFFLLLLFASPLSTYSLLTEKKVLIDLEDGFARFNVPSRGSVVSRPLMVNQVNMLADPKGRVEKTDPHSADYPLTPLRGLLYGLLRGLLYGLVRGLPCGLP